MATLIQGFDVRLTNWPFLVLTFEHPGAQGWAQRCSKFKAKNGRLASLASNPLVTVLILEPWAKWVNSWFMEQKFSVSRLLRHNLSFGPMSQINNLCSVLQNELRAHGYGKGFLANRGSGSAYPMSCVSVCPRRWCIVAKRLNGSSLVRVWGLPHRTAAL